MKLSYSAYTPPPPKKPKKFQRARFRGIDRSRSATGSDSKDGCSCDRGLPRLHLPPPRMATATTAASAGSRRPRHAGRNQARAHATGKQ